LSPVKLVYLRLRRKYESYLVFRIKIYRRMFIEFERRAAAHRSLISSENAPDRSSSRAILQRPSSSSSSWRVPSISPPYSTSLAFAISLWTHLGRQLEAIAHLEDAYLSLRFFSSASVSSPTRSRARRADETVDENVAFSI